MSAIAGPDVKRFYDAFAGRTLLRDFTRRNPRQRAVQRLCDRFVPRGARVLEIGCGAGVVSRHVAARASRYLGVDISDVNVALARRFAGGPGREFRVVDVVREVAHLDSEGPFDAILLADVIEHIPRDEHSALLERLATRIAPGGRLLLTFPSAAYQAHLERADPEALQVVDEKVDIATLLSGTSLLPLHLAHVDVWGENQYVHLVLVPAIDYRLLPPPGVGARLIRFAANLLWRLRHRGFLAEARRICAGPREG